MIDDLPGGPRGYQVLAAAGRENARTQLALAQQLGVDRTVMTYLLDDLERAGLVERRPDPADRRARQILLTKAGRERLCALERDLRAAEQHVLEPLDEADRTALQQLLRRLATRSGPDAGTCQAAQDICDVDPTSERAQRG